MLHNLSLKNFALIVTLSTIIFLTINWTNFFIIVSGYECESGNNYLCKFRESCGRISAENRDGNKTNSTSYIIGGEDVKQNEFPWLAQIRSRYFTACSAVIISDRHILTAAHCLTSGKFRQPFKYYRFKVFVGTNANAQFNLMEGLKNPVKALEIEQFCLHPKFRDDCRYDQAILLLRKPLQFNISVQPICWPNKAIEPNDTGDESKCFVAGIGFTNSSIDKLHPRRWTDYSPEKYQKAQVREISCGEDSDTMNVCFTGVDRGESVCRGDSGAPIYCFDQASERWYLKGIVTARISEEYYDTCMAGQPILSVAPLNEMLNFTNPDSECGDFWSDDENEGEDERKKKEEEEKKRKEKEEKEKKKKEEEEEKKKRDEEEEKKRKEEEERKEEI